MAVMRLFVAAMRLFVRMQRLRAAAAGAVGASVESNTRANQTARARARARQTLTHTVTHTQHTHTHIPARKASILLEERLGVEAVTCGRPLRAHGERSQRPRAFRFERK
eukprot:2801642-Rhodomonas_salina.3